MKQRYKSDSKKSTALRQSFSSMGEVRIIGGDWRGRKLPVLNGEGLRPTSDRVRETLFNWLQFEIAGAKCLDLYAGSGALGLEALSRGASFVTFCELNPIAVRQLRQNLQTLKIDSAKISEGDSMELIKSLDGDYDVVFVDPPFYQQLMQPSINALFANQLLNKDSWLYLEQEKNSVWPILADDWQCYREKTTSQVKYGLWHSA